MEKDGFREYIMSKESVLVDSDMSWRSFDDRQRVTPLDLMKIRRENPDLFFSKYFGNNLKHRPMKKYKSLRDLPNYPKGTIFVKDNPACPTKSHGWLPKTIHEAFMFLPSVMMEDKNWFEEIKEYEVTGNKNVSFSEEDMIEFGKYVKNREKFASLDMPTKHLLTLFMKRKGTSPMTKDELVDAKTKANGGKFYDLINDLGSNRYVGKQYPLKDMIDFARFVYDKLKPSTIPIDMTLLDQWIQKAHPEDCVTKKE